MMRQAARRYRICSVWLAQTTLTVVSSVGLPQQSKQESTQILQIRYLFAQAMFRIIFALEDKNV
jgi:hypothetical protein